MARAGRRLRRHGPWADMTVCQAKPRRTPRRRRGRYRRRSPGCHRSPRRRRRIQEASALTRDGTAAKPPSGDHCCARATSRQRAPGKPQPCPCRGAGVLTHTPPAEGGLRGHVPTRPGWSHPSSPVPVRRPTRVEGASFRRHRAMTPWPFASPSAPLIPGVGPCTPHALCHAWHTRQA
jgi:hypothetical protein